MVGYDAPNASETIVDACASGPGALVTTVPYAEGTDEYAQMDAAIDKCIAQGVPVFTANTDTCARPLMHAARMHRPKLSPIGPKTERSSQRFPWPTCRYHKADVEGNRPVPQTGHKTTHYGPLLTPPPLLIPTEQSAPAPTTRARCAPRTCCTATTTRT